MELRVDGRSSGKCFSLLSLAASVSRCCLLEAKVEYEVLQGGLGEFRANCISINILQPLPLIGQQPRAGHHHRCDDSRGDRASSQEVSALGFPTA